MKHLSGWCLLAMIVFFTSVAQEIKAGDVDRKDVAGEWSFTAVFTKGKMKGQSAKFNLTFLAEKNGKLDTEGKPFNLTAFATKLKIGSKFSLTTSHQVSSIVAKIEFKGKFNEDKTEITGTFSEIRGKGTFVARKSEK